MSVQPDHTDTVSACWYTRQTPDLCDLDRKRPLNKFTVEEKGSFCVIEMKGNNPNCHTDAIGILYVAAGRAMCL